MTDTPADIPGDDEDDVLPPLINTELPHPAPKNEKQKAENLGALMEALGSIVTGMAALRTSLTSLGKKYKDVKRYGRRNRFWIIVSCVGLALDLCLSGTVIYLYHRIDGNTSVAKINCRTSQAFGKGMNDLFGPYIKEAVKVETDPKKLADTKQFQALLDGYEHRDCEHIGSPVPRTTTTAVTVKTSSTVTHR